MPVALYDSPWWTPSGLNAQLLSGQVAHVYADAALTIHADLYTDETGTTAASNPTTIDSAGNLRFFTELDYAWVKVGAFAAVRVQVQSRSNGHTKPAVLIFDGDSLTGDSGAGPYPSIVQSYLSPRTVTSNFGVAAQTLENMQTDAVAQVDSQFLPNKRSVLVAWGGSNDLYFGASAATVQARISAYAATRKAQGWELIMCTILPRTGVGTPAGFEAARLTVNAWMRTRVGAEFDRLVDVAGVAELQDSNNATYYSDFVHLTHVGYRIVADRVLDALGLAPGDSGWVNATLLNGYTAAPGWATPGYRRIGGVTYLRGLLTHATGSAANSIMFTIPSYFRIGAFELIDQSHPVTIGADGHVRDLNGSAASGIVSVGGISFPVDL